MGGICHGKRAITHDHQLKRGPSDQLNNIEQHRQACKTAAKHLVHEACARQTTVATHFGYPTKQARAHDGTHNGDQQSFLRAQPRNQVSTDLHDQQSDAQTEPK